MKLIDIVFVHQLKRRHDLIWHQRYHKHKPNQYEFHYFLAGEGSLFIKETQHPFKKHELFISLPEEMHAVQSRNCYLAPISYYAILFELESKDTELKFFLEDPDFINQFPFVVSHRNHFIFKILLEQRMQEKNIFLHKSAEYKLYSYLYEIFSTRLEHKLHEKKLLPNYTSSNIHIEKAINYMNRAIYENVSIATIALHIRISQEYLIKLFKQYLDTTPYAYFMQIKIEEICGLLTNTNMKINEIANKFQFSNAQNFTRTFIKQVGISPTEYRNIYLYSSGMISKASITKKTSTIS